MRIVTRSGERQVDEVLTAEFKTVMSGRYQAYYFMSSAVPFRIVSSRVVSDSSITVKVVSIALGGLAGAAIRNFLSEKFGTAETIASAELVSASR